MENDFINVPKLVMLTSNKPETNIKVNKLNASVINSIYFWEKYHKINSFIENNQYKIYTIEVPFCIEDYYKLKLNNRIIDTDGITEGEIISVKWNVYNQTANINYKLKKQYTNNLKETTILSDGR